MPLAVITFEFDPLVEIAGLTVRWETLAIAGAVLVGLLLAALLARRDRSAPDDPLRLDDMLSVLVAIVPGQPEYELIPYTGTEFNLKGMAGFSVEFSLDEAGKPLAATLKQPAVRVRASAVASGADGQPVGDAAARGYATAALISCAAAPPDNAAGKGLIWSRAVEQSAVSREPNSLT